MPRRKFYKRHRTIIRLEAYTTGAFDFKQYAQHKESLPWVIKHNLVLNHMSMRISRDGIAAAKHYDSEVMSSLLDTFIGVSDSMQDTHDSSDIKYLDAKTIMSMSNDQLSELYNKIIQQVVGDTK